MAVFNNILAGASGQTGGAAAGYEITRSLRFNSGDSAYLNRTPSSAGNRKTWTWSAWVKPSNVSAYETLFSTDYNTSGNYGSEISFTSGRNLVVYQNVSGTAVANVSTQGVFRDASAWYHFVVSFDTTNSTANDRVKIYVNGELAPVTVTTAPAQNAEGEINAAEPHYIGAFNLNSSLTRHFNGYLADVHFIDGQALDPTDFGEFDETTGVWNPIEFTPPATPNNGTTWSANASGTPYSGSYTWASAFDGSFATGAAGGVNTPNEYKTSFTGVSFTTGVTVYGNSNTADLWLNGTQVFMTGATAVGSLYKKTFTSSDIGSSSFSEIGVDAGITIYAVEVDGVILIDGNTTNIGLNGFHLDFADNSSAAALGHDAAGSNDWTVNNISVTAGAGNDSLFDSPTNANAASDTGAGGEVSGNYATLNPLNNNSCTLSEGNLKFVTAGNNSVIWATQPIPTYGKWCFESTFGGGDMAFMLDQKASTTPTNVNLTSTGIAMFMYYATGSTDNRFHTNSTATAFDTSFTTDSVNDVYMFEVDMDNGTMRVKKQDGSDSGLFTMPSALTAAPLFPGFSVISTWPAVTQTLNFGQRSFTNTASSGFKALCTANYDDPTIADGSTAMDVALYTGDGNSGQTVTGLNFSPDFVWFKSRSAAYNHGVFDSVRGVQNRLHPNLTQAEDVSSTGLTAFNSDGFTFGGNNVNGASGQTYVAWTWDGGSSTVSNTDGSITSSVRANASAGFSITAVTMPSSGDPTIGHGLGVKPEFIIFKSRTTAEKWYISHKGLTNQSDRFLRFDTDPEITNANWFASTAPTSSVITLRVGGAVSANQDVIIYSWTSVEGYSAFGSYTGNGSSDGPFVYTGFRPKYLLWKVTQNNSNYAGWYTLDASTSPYNEAKNRLHPNASSTEATMSNGIDFLSNGFKLRSSDTDLNGAYTYIYAAFAENPFKYARAR